MTTGDNRWQQVATGGNRWQQVTTVDNSWQQLTTVDNSWQQVTTKVTTKAQKCCHLLSLSCKVSSYPWQFRQLPEFCHSGKTKKCLRISHYLSLLDSSIQLSLVKRHKTKLWYLAKHLMQRRPCLSAYNVQSEDNNYLFSVNAWGLGSNTISNTDTGRVLAVNWQSVRLCAVKSGMDQVCSCTPPATRPPASLQNLTFKITRIPTLHYSIAACWQHMSIRIWLAGSNIC